MAGLLYLGQYRDTLIESKLETLKVESQLFAGVIAEGAVASIEENEGYLYRQAGHKSVLVNELSRRMVLHLSEATHNRTRLFDHNGDLIVDSHRLMGPEGPIDITALPPLTPPTDELTKYLRAAVKLSMEYMPTNTTLPLYKPVSTDKMSDLEDAYLAFQDNDTVARSWQDHDGVIILTAASPVIKGKNPVGVIYLSKEATDIENSMIKLRSDVLRIFLAALSITILLSLYLANVIGRPLRKLAKAAEIVRQGKGGRIDIPDLRYRNDEIGELSMALHDMTRALRDRMDTIEKFAADVSHELKNPLSSLRSALETVERIDSDDDRKRLMHIIHHDVQRLDRLISDISKASRIDAELARDELAAVNIDRLLSQLVEARRSPLIRVGKVAKTDKEENNLVLLVPNDETDSDDNADTEEAPNKKHIQVFGMEGQLAQVFDNLITNALSFSPQGEKVTIRLTEEEGTVTVTVDDNGPGIPENKLEEIFERFYSERPKHEDYGSHSGLGLSIVKQIITAHNATISAENRKDDHDKVLGARFTVTFKSLS